MWNALNRRDLIKVGTLWGATWAAGQMADDAQPVFAQEPAPALPTLVHFVLIDKVQAALFQHVTDGTIPPGLDAMDGLARTAVNFRGMNLTKLFGDPLAALPESVGLVINNAWESGSGGHSLANSVVSAELGGINAAFEKLAGNTGVLGPVGFSLGSDANNSSDAFLGAGGRRMNAFTSVGHLATTLRNSIAPLLKTDNLALLKDLDSLVSTSTGFRDNLAQLAQKVGQALPDLESAQTVTDPVMQQVKAIIALRKAGVARNFMLAVPWDDTNGGGNLTTRGGSRNLDPFSATPLIAQALVELHANISDLYCVSTSDGGRSQNNGDVGPGFGFLTGPTQVGS